MPRPDRRGRRGGRAIALAVLVCLAGLALVGTVGGQVALDAGTEREGVVVPPETQCTAAPTTVAVGEPVTLDASGTTNATYVAFDREPDGTTDRTDETDLRVNVTYAEPGTYQPTATGHNLDGNDTAGCGTVEVLANQPPTAAISYVPGSPRPGETVTFDGTGSSDPDGDVVFYTWEVERQFAAEDNRFDRSFPTTGVYNVTLTVEDDDGATDTSTVFVDVAANEPPDAAFTFSPTSPGPGETVTFDASASADPDGSVTEYAWDFDGDGTVDRRSGQPVVTTSYGTSGANAATLTVTDGDGATDEATRTVRVATEPSAVCGAEPTTVAPGAPVTLDASGSDATFVRFDVDGDGTYDRTDETDFRVNTTYDEPGTYQPRVRAERAGQTDEAGCGTVTVEEVVPPEAALDVSPSPATADESVTLDASASTDPDGTIVEYRFDVDGDGTVENTSASPVVTTTYDAGSFAPTVTVVDDDGATARAARDLRVEQAPPVARCTATPTDPEPGEVVVLDAGESEGAYVQFDVDGDGTYDRTDETDFRINTSYDGGERAPRVQVVRGDQRAEADCGSVVVVTPGGGEEEPPATGTESGGGPDIPLVPVGIGIGALALGALLKFAPIGGVGGGGGGAGGGGSRSGPTPKPRPSGGGSGPARYETGTFVVPPESGTVSVAAGFEPDLLRFRGANAAREDSATDRTAGWATGTAVVGDGEIAQQCVTVADDAASTDQATAATDEDALVLVRHGDGAPGRVRVRVDETTADGFSVQVSVPGNDPTAGGIRVLYQAIRTAGDAEAALGTFHTPTEPGTQVVDLGFSADHFETVATTAVGDPGRTWTTDQSAGVTTGYAVGTDDPSQAAWSGGAWPGRSAEQAAAVSTSEALHLLYQDADRLAGRTRATVVGLGETARLRYDRVYNGPHKLGSTARHPVQFLAMDTGDSMTPAVGAIAAPAAGESLSVACGFEPALVELTVCGAAPDTEVAANATTEPFGWSQGTAVVRDGILRQYGLHGTLAGQDDPGAAGAAANGGSPAAAATDGGTEQATDPTAEPDDGVAGAWRATDAEGRVVGREELRVTGVSEAGFDLAVRAVTAGEADDERPTVCYRAWPAVEGEGGTEAATESGDGASGADTTEHRGDTK